MTEKSYSTKMKTLEKQLRRKKSLRKNIAAVVLFGLYIVMIAAAFIFIYFIVSVWSPNMNTFNSTVELSKTIERTLEENSDTSISKIAESLDSSSVHPFSIIDENGTVAYSSKSMTETDLNGFTDLSALIPDFYYDRELSVYIGEIKYFKPYYEIGLLTPIKLCRDIIFTPDKKPEILKGYSVSSVVMTRTTLSGGKYTLISKDITFRTAMDRVYIMLTADIAIAVSIVPLLLYIFTLISSWVSQKRLSELLYLDTSTLGRNWLYFTQHGTLVLRKKKNADMRFAIVSLRAGKYRNYCTCFGIAEGEQLLERISKIIESGIKANEAFARHSKSEFGLLLVMESTNELQERMERLRNELTNCAKGHRISFSFGLYEITDKHKDIEESYSCASMARDVAARKKDTGLLWFDEEMKQAQLWERKVEETMETALKNHEFKVYLQPKYSSATHTIAGAEALIRWISPDEGTISPGKFIPIFEKNGFITKIDDYMLTAVAELQARRIAENLPVIPISVNISRSHFAMPDFAAHICEIIDKANIPRSCIELELTESAFFDGKELLLRIILELKKQGFSISMDDFGSGYSSLNSLKDLPLDILKLDMDFFRGDMDDRGRIVVTQAIQLAKLLKMIIVAEGIETKEQVDFLAESGCDMIQGYYFAKPMPVSDFEEILASEKNKEQAS